MPSVNHPTPPGFMRRRGPKGRIVFEPTEETRDIHKNFLASLGKVSFSDQFECVRPHLRNRFFLKLDLKDAFDRVDVWSAEVFLNLGFDGNEQYFFHKNAGLIQGAPSSPVIFNLYCAERLDKDIREYCARRGIAYTRYADDLLFSCEWRFGKKLRKEIRKLIGRGGFAVNDRKTVVADNKYTPITWLGIEVVRCHARLQRAFMVKLAERNVQHPRKKLTGEALEEWRDRRMEGLRAWKRRVLALNVKNG